MGIGSLVGRQWCRLPHVGDGIGHYDVVCRHVLFQEVHVTWTFFSRYHVMVEPSYVARE